MTTKQFKLSGDQIVQLIPSMGFCYATDKITVDGEPINYFYREKPDEESDSGWRFFSGTETQEYADDPNNSSIYDVNTIVNYDPKIIGYLDLPFGTELERVGDTGIFQITKQN